MIANATSQWEQKEEPHANDPVDLEPVSLSDLTAKTSQFENRNLEPTKD